MIHQKENSADKQTEGLVLSEPAIQEKPEKDNIIMF